MKKQCTELIFILDRSGSMSGLEKSTIEGYNHFLGKQKEEPNEALVSTILFDNESIMLHNRENIQVVRPLTDHDYTPGGCTALLDAIGNTIQYFTKAHLETPGATCPDKTLMVIITDGMENASTEFNHSQIIRLINEKKESGWEFLFLGANIEAMETAESIGINRDNACDYHADEEGTSLNFESINEAVKSYRAGCKLDRSWKKSIESDYQRRKSQK
ncbi:VWA domain-containing protein [Clostridia bacterium]|nr:VWA domain-containing protein [Clostridia bacterium]